MTNGLMVSLEAAPVVFDVEKEMLSSLMMDIVVIALNGYKNGMKMMAIY